ncbi:MAG: site-specific integrase [Rhodospirillaceae bacterium]|nr:site-specific integrase [Rhodospirillaceae bacterium]MCY4065703.1 site-specific integrase [Rhodospirillaceae bacterium]
MGAVKLSKRTIDRLSVERASAVFWDSELPGFGIRVHATGRKLFVAQARTPGGLPKRATVGRYEDMDAEDARLKAAGMIDRIRRGRDPVPTTPEEPTVADLAARFMTAHVEMNCKPGTVESYRSLLRLCILPGLGGLRLSEVDRPHVSALHHGLRATPSRANQAVGVFSKMFKLAVAWGLTPARPNPCRSIRRYGEGSCERFLTEDEYARLGRVLFEAESEGPLMASAVAAVRLLLLTGCRRNEILMLRWDDMDRRAGELRLRDSKSGPRRVPLTPAVERVLARIPRAEDNPWVIAGDRPGSRLKRLDPVWNKLRARAGLDGLRLHDCRHSYASRALAIGESLSAISRLLGHKTVMTTVKYAHLARDTERASAAKVGDSIGSDLLADDAAEAA